MRTRDTLALRFTALAAGIPVILLRAMLDPRTVALTLFFYLTPYLLIAFAPNRWRGFQAGFAAGYSLSMQAAIIATLILNLGFSAPLPPTVFYSAFRYANLALTIIAIITWIWSRKSVAHLTAAAMVALGLVYPFCAFFIEFLIAGTIYR